MKFFPPLLFISIFVEQTNKMTSLELKNEISSLVKEVALLLSNKGETISTVESCTGGRIASEFTSVAGSSKWFHTGWVTYQESSKKEVLGVEEKDLVSGVVSEKCAQAMAERGRVLSQSCYAVSTTGSTGPDSLEGHPPCCAWIAISTHNKCYTRWIERPDEGRSLNQDRIVYEALTLLLSILR